jgi:predicted ATPase
MLVAVSGSQGAGKTTIINKLIEKKFRSVKRKTSRSIQSEWNVTLEDIIRNPDLTVKFQDEILLRKMNDERLARGSNMDIVVTERTYADLFTYAVIWLGRENRFKDYLNDYYNRCMRAQQSYDLIYFIKGGHFPITFDPNRAAVSPHYGRMVDLTMFDITVQMSHPSRVNVIDVLDADQRANIIAAQMSSIQHRQESEFFR